MSDTTGAVSSKSSRANSAEAFTPGPEVLKSWNEVHNGMRGEFGEAVFRAYITEDMTAFEAEYHEYLRQLLGLQAG